MLVSVIDGIPEVVVHPNRNVSLENNQFSLLERKWILKKQEGIINVAILPPIHMMT